ncbi:MAG: hypothetical protein FWF81_04795 [Defluviitaleaceae bacterium]|nr:hypothetical protein [Defluviitaleaceae bacterium]
MNRIEVVALFTALKELADSENMSAIKNIINAVLEEARLADKIKTSDRIESN